MIVPHARNEINRTARKLRERHAARVAGVAGFHDELRGFEVGAVPGHNEAGFGLCHVRAVNVVHLGWAWEIKRVERETQSDST
jgi:hypothetical protein